MQPDGMQHWGVAVVRRLLRDDANQLHVGAEILANRVASVAIKYNIGKYEEEQTALWLYPKPGVEPGETQLLLMVADTFSPNRSLKIQLDQNNYLLMPSLLQEKGLDYDLAKFRLIVQEADSDEAY
jgi:hypothetical protein